MRAWVRWTKAEDRMLERMYADGRSTRFIATALARSPKSVRERASRLNLRHPLTNKKLGQDETTRARGSFLGLVGAIRAERTRQGIPSRELDDIAGIAAGYTSKVEAGMKGYGHRTIDALLRALDVDIQLVPRCRSGNRARDMVGE